MQIKDVSDEELKKYVLDNIPQDEREEYDSREKADKLLSLAKGHISGLSSGLKNLSELLSVKVPSSYFVGQEISSINRHLRSISDEIYQLSIISGSSNKEDRKRAVEVPLKFTQNGERLHIVFPDLLPKRVTKDTPYTYADIKMMYTPAFENHFRTGKHKIYAEKAVIVYTHYFESEKDFIDHDNFETKIITDLITSWLLLDDSPKNCAIFSDYKIGDKSHTEVDVMPYKDFRNFI